MGVRGVLDDIALVAQLTGLHAIMLAVLAARVLRIPQCDAKCGKLEERARRLRVMLQWTAAAGRDRNVTMQLPAMAAGALVAADGLVDSYRRSTLWCRVRTARSMEARLQDARYSVDCLLALPLCSHFNDLFAVQPASVADARNSHLISDPSHGAEACDGPSDSQSFNGVGQGGVDDQSYNTEAGGFESSV